MSTRIRYRKTNQEGILESVQRFQHPTETAQRLKVFLNTKENKWTVVDDTTDLVQASGHQVNLQRMKIEVKKALGELGIVFSDEKRKGKYNQNVDTLNEDAREVISNENQGE